MTVAEALKRFRKEFKITQKQAAQAAGVHERVYQSYEYGKVTPSVANMVKLAEAFNTSVDYLLGGTDFLTDEMLDQIIMNTLVEHDEKVEAAGGSSKFGDKKEAMEFAALLLRNYHKTLRAELAAQGIKI